MASLPRRFEPSSHQLPWKAISMGVWVTFIKYLIPILCQSIKWNNLQYEFSVAELAKTWILVTALFRATFGRINKISMSSIFTSTQNVIILFTESISTEYHRPTVQEIFGMTPSTSLSSCASSSSSPTFRERSHSSSGSSKGRLSGGTIRTHWPFLRNSQDWTVRYLF